MISPLKYFKSWVATHTNVNSRKGTTRRRLQQEDDETLGEDTGTLGEIKTFG